MDSTQPSSHERFGRAWPALVAGLLLLGVYLAGSVSTKGFIDRELDYRQAHVLQRIGLGFLSHDQDFVRVHMLGDIWRISFLFPATVLLAFGFARLVPQRWTDSVLRRLIEIRTETALTILVLLVLGILFFLASFVFQEQPVYDDERAYLFQAKVFATGVLAAPLPPVPAAFENNFLIYPRGGWVGKYTAGHPALLVPGLLLGYPRLVPIFMAAFVLPLLYLIGRHFYDRRTALLAAALLVVSPAFLFPAATLMNHGTSLFFLTVFTLAYLRTHPGKGWWWPVLAGLALGIVLNVRPQDAVAYGTPFAVWSLWQVFHKRTLSAALRHFVILVFFCGPLAFFLYYNYRVTGDWRTTPFQWHAPNWDYGTSPPKGTGAVAGYIKGAVFTGINTIRMNTWLFGWPISLVFVGSLLLRGNLSRREVPLFAVLVSTAALYFGFTSAGLMELGARYYIPMLIPLTLLTAHEMCSLHVVVTKKTSAIRALVPVFTALSILLAALTFVPPRAAHYVRLTDNAAMPERLARTLGLRNAVVQILQLPPTGWVFGYPVPSPDLSEEVLFVRPKKHKPMLALMEALPERQYYRLRYNEETGKTKIIPIGPAQVREAMRIMGEE